MKKILLLILFISSCCPTVIFSEPLKSKDQINQEKLLTNYRLYPFQWIFPEYYYKSEIIRVKKAVKPPQGYTKIDFFGLTAQIPTRYMAKIKRQGDAIQFKSKTKDWIMMIKSSDDSLLCYDDTQIKDYCSAFKTPQELFHKLFTLTPETADSVGDKWIVHAKGIVFENVKKIEIYSSDKYIAYVKFIKDSFIKETKFSHKITLFHVSGPINSHVIISFLAKEETLMNNFLSTIE